MATGKLRIQDFLTTIPLFQGLSPAELDMLATATAQVHAARGEVIFKQGDPCLGFHCVMYGHIKLALTSPVGDEKVVRLITQGGSFGEALMFMGRSYIVTAQALEDSLLLHVSRDGLYAHMDRHPALARKMIASLSERLHALMRDVEAYSLRSGAQRVIGYLLRGGADEDEGASQVRLPASKLIIASRLNLTPEHFSRILRDLSDRGLIEVRGREIIIPDTQRLARHEV